MVNYLVKDLKFQGAIVLSHLVEVPLVHIEVLLRWKRRCKKSEHRHDLLPVDEVAAILARYSNKRSHSLDSAEVNLTPGIGHSTGLE